MKLEYHHIRFVDFTVRKQKTKTFICQNIHLGIQVGWVIWFDEQYVFQPSNNVGAFRASTLADIQHFIMQLMKDRKEVKP